VLLLIVLMIYEVIVRYLFSAPTVWGPAPSCGL
jgi:TRAP-type C4-dicarboxylate transport system permease small subunit